MFTSLPYQECHNIHGVVGVGDGCVWVGGGWEGGKYLVIYVLLASSWF